MIISSIRQAFIIIVLVIIVLKYVGGEKQYCSPQVLGSYQIGETVEEDFPSEDKEDFSLQDVFAQMRSLYKKEEKGKLENQKSDSREKYLSKGNLLEGDILVDSEYTLSKIINESTSLYGIESLLGNPWPNAVVPFIFHDNYTLGDQMAVALAMKEIQSVSCVRFKMRTNEESFISFYKADGCSSHVGFQKIVQGLSLTDECLQHHSIILHMLMHALGFWHETTRADRDKYIKINWKNINPKFMCNYRRFHSMSWKALHYDGDSILHFSQRSFAIDNDVRKPTFVFIDGDQVLGKRLSERPTKLSQLDIKKILIKYDCYSRNWQHGALKDEKQELDHDLYGYEDISEDPLISGRGMTRDEIEKGKKGEKEIEREDVGRSDEKEKMPIGKGKPPINSNQLDYDGGTIDLNTAGNRASSRFGFFLEKNPNYTWLFAVFHLLIVTIRFFAV